MERWVQVVRGPAPPPLPFDDLAVERPEREGIQAAVAAELGLEPWPDVPAVRTVGRPSAEAEYCRKLILWVLGMRVVPQVLPVPQMPKGWSPSRPLPMQEAHGEQEVEGDDEAQGEQEVDGGDLEAHDEQEVDGADQTCGEQEKRRSASAWAKRRESYHRSKGPMRKWVNDISL